MERDREIESKSRVKVEGKKKDTHHTRVPPILLVLSPVKMAAPKTI